MTVPLSNRGYRVHFLDKNVKTIWSFDKLVLLITIPKISKYNDFLEEHIRTHITDKKMDVTRFDDYKFYRRNYCFDDMFLSFNYTNEADPDNNNLRIEFNPNKKYVSDFEYYFSVIPQEYLNTLRFSRFDVANDYCDINLYPQFFYDSMKRVWKMYGMSKTVDSYYLGSNQSDVQFKIYNKQKEILKRYKITLDVIEEEEIERFDFKQAYFDFKTMTQREKKISKKRDAEILEKCFGRKNSFFTEISKEVIEEVLKNEGLDISKPVWRIECQIRKNAVQKISAMNLKPFENLKAYFDYTDMCLKNQDIDFKFQFFLNYARDFGLQCALKKIDKYETRQTYIKFLDDFYEKTQLITPHQMWEQCFDEQYKKLSNDIKKSFRVSHELKFDDVRK